MDPTYYKLSNTSLRSTEQEPINIFESEIYLFL